MLVILPSDFMSASAQSGKAVDVFLFALILEFSMKTNVIVSTTTQSKWLLYVH